MSASKFEQADLKAFLPAAIEVEQTPSSCAGRLIIWLIMFLFVVAVCWAWFGKVDIVAVAQGKVIPTESVKQIQSLETARIKAIRVKEGQLVEQGQVLIELDAQLAKAEYESLKAELAGVRQNLQRLERLSEFLSLSDLSPESIKPRSDPVVEEFPHPLSTQPLSTQPLSTQQHAQLLQEKSEVAAQLANFQNERIKLQIEQSMTQGEIKKKQRVIPVIQERVDALDTLLKKSYGSKLQYLELKQELIEQQQDLAVQQARLNQLKQSEQSISTQQTLYLAEKRKQTLAEQNALQVQSDALFQQVTKAEQRLTHYTLIAPITGQVQQLATTTIDGVVQSAQLLMHIVPRDSALEVEAMIQNKDIGFVQEGQKAVVKVDTFNFTKYGLIDAQISSISDDAISKDASSARQNESQGLVYNARVTLNQDKLLIDGREVRLSPGMSVTTEIKTGQRRLIEFFLSPLLRYKQESLGER